MKSLFLKSLIPAIGLAVSEEIIHFFALTKNIALIDIYLTYAYPASALENILHISDWVPFILSPFTGFPLYNLILWWLIIFIVAFSVSKTLPHLEAPKIAVSGLLVALTIFSLFAYFQAKQEVDANKETVSQDQTTNWKTYRNDIVGIKFQYPSSWPEPKSPPNREPFNLPQYRMQYGNTFYVAVSDTAYIEFRYTTSETSPSLSLEQKKNIFGGEIKINNGGLRYLLYTGDTERYKKLVFADFDVTKNGYQFVIVFGAPTDFEKDRAGYEQILESINLVSEDDIINRENGKEIDMTLRDMERIGKIKQFQSFLELRFDSKLSYPDYPVMPLSEPITSYNSLPVTLIPYGLVTNPKDSELGVYYYGVADDWKHYVVGITLENRNNSALDVDEDGIIFGVRCDDPVFCVKN